MIVGLALPGCGDDGALPDASAPADATVRSDASRDGAVPLDAERPDSGEVADAGGDGEVVTDAPCADRDADGVCDEVDHCPDAADAANTDTDGDGIGDACECDDVDCEGSACIARACDPETGTCVDTAMPDGTTCDDGDACTEVDACASGVCTGGSPIVCAPIDDCHAPGTCEPSTGACEDGPPLDDGTACDDGDPCTQVDACASGACVGSSPVVCAPIDACHVAGSCDPSTGECVAGDPRPDGTGCDDGNACTQVDACASGACEGTSPVVCAPIDACHGPGTCAPATGLCAPGAALPDGTACSDGNACTQVDACASGACVGTSPVVCAPINACRLPGTCVPTSGRCATGRARPNGTACDDGNACTEVDACSSGTCRGSSPVVCTPIDDCHAAGTCSPATGSCGAGPALPDGTTCDDGNDCTRVDRCSSGACAGSSPVVCTPIDVCHAAGTCTPATGMCTTPPAACSIEVLIRVRSATGAVLPDRAYVRAFQGTTALPYYGATDASGNVRLTLPGGSYRFRAVQESGVPTFSGTTDHCTMPTCTVVDIRIPATTPLLAVSWDPFVLATYGGGEIVDGSPHITRGGVYLESWAIDHYGRTGAALIATHDHVGDLTGVADGYGNPTNAENQHAFGEMLQGFFIRLEDGGAFDLVSLDYRIREDTDPTHVSMIPGVSATNVQIWIARTLAVPTTSFSRFSIGSGGAEMTTWGTLSPTTFTNVTGVYITSTDNVTFDNVVLRPR